VQEGIDRLLEKSQCTVLLIAHRLSTVMHADQIAVINGGKIHELGNHDALVKEGGIYAKLVSRQMKRDENVINEQNLVDTGSSASGGDKGGKSSAGEGSKSGSPADESGTGKVSGKGGKKGMGKKGGGKNGSGGTSAKTEIDELFESIETK